MSGAQRCRAPGHRALEGTDGFNGGSALSRQDKEASECSDLPWAPLSRDLQSLMVKLALGLGLRIVGHVVIADLLLGSEV